MTSIIILSYNTQKMTQLCIESIRRHTRDGAYEIIVVDNASTDGSLKYLRAQRDVRLIENRINRGFPAGCNQGLHAAKGDELLFLNSDTVVTPRWLDNMKRALYSAEDIGAVSCVTNSCSNLQQISVSYETLEEMERMADGHNVSDPAKWYPWLMLVGFAFLMKRSAYECAGGFDEAFSPGNYEDADLSIRLRLAGYDLLLCKDTFIHHFGSASFLQNKSAEELAAREEAYEGLISKNQSMFLQKWNLDERFDDVEEWVVKDALEGADYALGRHITLVGCSYGRELSLLHTCAPNAVITGISFSQDDMRLISPRLSVRYAASLEETVDVVPDAQDYIILQEEMEDAEAQLCLLEKLAEKLRLGGKLVWREDGKMRIEELV